MGQTAVELPDPLGALPAPAAGADDLLSQLAGAEIDRLMADANIESDTPDTSESEVEIGASANTNHSTKAAADAVDTEDARPLDRAEDLMPAGAALESDPVITAELDDAFERTIGESSATTTDIASAPAGVAAPEPQTPSATIAVLDTVADAAAAAALDATSPATSVPEAPPASGELDDLLSQMAANDAVKEAAAATNPTVAPTETTIAAGPSEATQPAVEARRAGEPPAAPTAPVHPPMSAAALEIAAELDASQGERSALGIAAPATAPASAPSDTAPNAAATAPEAAPLAAGDIVTAGHESAAVAEHAPERGKLIRILEWINAPLADSPVLRDAVGKVAVMTLINAIAILIYVEFIRHEPTPAARAPDKAQVHSPPDHETAR